MMRIWLGTILCAGTATLLGCGGEGGGINNPDAPVVTDDGSSECTREPAPADRPRHVVVSHPYDASGNASTMFEVLALSTTGELTQFSPPRTFELARVSFGVIEFTRDGELGIVPTERGKLAVFRLDADGNPTVVDAGFSGAFYADTVIPSPDGKRLWITDGNTRANGGGIYAVDVECDDTLVDRGLVVPADFPRAMRLAPGNPDLAVIAARSVLDTSPAGHDLHVVELADPPRLVTGGDVFGDDDAIVRGAALTRDGGFFLAGDTSPVRENRIGVASLANGTVTAAGILAPFFDPQSIVASPFGDVALATSTLDAEQIFILDRGGANGAWRNAGRVAYKDGDDPELPGDMVMIERGSLTGHVFVSENISIRHLAFQPDGTVVDFGALQIPGGVEANNGVIGVTP